MKKQEKIVFQQILNSPEVPIVTTSNVSAVTSGGVTSGGNVVSARCSDVTERGVCWSMEPSPAVYDNCLPDTASGEGTFTIIITGLEPDTTYYLRAYAKNGEGISYGDQKIFKTDREKMLPSVMTETPASITSTGVISGGNVTSDGGSGVTERGVCWSENPSPAASGNKLPDNSSGLGTFTSHVTGLNSETMYYIRAYATNEIGTAYGGEEIFETARSVTIPSLATEDVSSITLRGVTVIGNVISDGGASVTEKGVCWRETTSPTVSDNKLQDSSSGLGRFKSIVTGLTPETTYYIRTYAINTQGVSYGEEQTFKTLAEVTLPSVTTGEISSVTSSDAISGGNVASDGGASVTERGVCWSNTFPPTISDSKLSDGDSGIGYFNSIITGLNPETTYYLRAYATNSEGTSYGTGRTFTTDSLETLPIITTNDISSVTSAGATSGGNVISDDGSDVTERGVCWSTTSPPTISNNKLADSSLGIGIFTSLISGLNPGTKYHLRAYAKSSTGIAYGEEKVFSTLSEVVQSPTLTTEQIRTVTLTRVISGGNIISEGGSAITERGVCWSTTSPPTVSDNKLADTSSFATGPFTSVVTGLVPDTTYYLRAYAINSEGTSYGKEMTVNTLSIPGDVDCSEATELSDLRLTLKILAGTGHTDNICNADVNDNGITGMEEAVHILQKLTK